LVLEGWEYFLDNMVHLVNPVLYILYWLMYRTKGRLYYTDGVKWLIFPLLYLVYSLIRGAAIHWYPYPFLNAGKLGYPAVLVNIFIILAVSLAAGIGLIAINRQAVGFNAALLSSQRRTKKAALQEQIDQLDKIIAGITEMTELKEELMALRDKLKDQKDSISDISEEDMLQLQQLMEACAQLEQMLSNTLKAVHHVKCAIAGNLKS